MSISSQGRSLGAANRNMGIAQRSFHPANARLQLELDCRNRKWKGRMFVLRGAALLALRHCVEGNLIVALADERVGVPRYSGRIYGITLLQEPRLRLCPDGRSDDP